MKKHKSIGSDFEEWLNEEGILEEVKSAVTKKLSVKKRKHRNEPIGKIKIVDDFLPAAKDHLNITLDRLLH